MAAQDFSWASVKKYVESFPKVLLLEVQFADSENEWLPLVACSDHELANRIRWLTGREVAAVRPYQAEERTAEPAARLTAQAQDEIPAWPCAARTEALEKRGERDRYADTSRTRSS
jgi:hypothetical protein